MKQYDQAALHTCDEFAVPAASHYLTQAGLQEFPESGSCHETYSLEEKASKERK